MRPLEEAARRAGVRDEKVLRAVAAVPRAAYVPRGREREADRDRPVVLQHGQTTSQPSLVARMVEALELTGVERVLEVGTGAGWQTALLTHLAAEVWSIERFAALAEGATAALAAPGSGVGPAPWHVVVGDGTLGVPEAAPFDAVVVSAAGLEVPRALAQQLAPGGRLVQPVGPGSAARVTLYRGDPAAPDGLREDRLLAPARFVPLVPGSPGAPPPER